MRRQRWRHGYVMNWLDGRAFTAYMKIELDLICSVSLPQRDAWLRRSLVGFHHHRFAMNKWFIPIYTINTISSPRGRDKCRRWRRAITEQPNNIHTIDPNGNNKRTKKKQNRTLMLNVISVEAFACVHRLRLRLRLCFVYPPSAFCTQNKRAFEADSFRTMYTNLLLLALAHVTGGWSISIIDFCVMWSCWMHTHTHPSGCANNKIHTHHNRDRTVNADWVHRKLCANTRASSAMCVLYWNKIYRK